MVVTGGNLTLKFMLWFRVQFVTNLSGVVALVCRRLGLKLAARSRTWVMTRPPCAPGRKLLSSWWAWPHVGSLAVVLSLMSAGPQIKGS